VGLRNTNRAAELHILASSIRHALIERAEKVLNTDAEPEEHDFPEGALKYRHHVTRERNLRSLYRERNSAHKVRTAGRTAKRVALTLKLIRAGGARLHTVPSRYTGL
jgi:hypothetical protein